MKIDTKLNSVSFMVCLRGAVVGGYVPKDAGFLAMLGETTKRKVCKFSSASKYGQRLAVETQ